MPFETDKPFKVCFHCGKQVRNLGLHVINNHPKILETIEENNSPEISEIPKQSYTQTKNISQKVISGDTHELIRQHLETTLNMRLIQMLEKGVPIEDVQRILSPPSPPQSSGLDDIKKLVEIQRMISPNAAPIIAEESASSFDWGSLISAAMPIIAQMLANRNKNNMESEKYGLNTSGLEETSTRILKPISEEITGNPTEPRSFSEEPGDHGSTIKPIDIGNANLSQRT